MATRTSSMRGIKWEWVEIRVKVEWVDWVSFWEEEEEGVAKECSEPLLEGNDGRERVSRLWEDKGIPRIKLEPHLEFKKG